MWLGEDGTKLARNVEAPRKAPPQCLVTRGVIGMGRTRLDATNNTMRRYALQKRLKGR